MSLIPTVVSRTHPSIISNQIYRHYKNKLYKIITTARSTTDPNSIHVIYQALYDDKVFGDYCVWSRELSQFIDEVEVDGIRQKRFTQVKEYSDLYPSNKP